MDEKTFVKHIIKARGVRQISATDLISIDNLKKADIELIFELAEIAENLLKGEMKKVSLGKGKSQINLFTENSTRTRTSFEMAGKNLGIDVVNISGESSSITKGETLLDTAITIDQLQPDIVVLRSSKSGAAEFLAKNVKASVINAGDGKNEHPTQGLLDLYTIQKFLGKNLKGKKMVIVGDILHSRVFGSLARIAKIFGIKIVVSCPHTLVRPHLEVFSATHEPDLDKALIGADIIYSLRLQTERAAAGFVPTLREYSKTYIINAKRLKIAKENAIVMHPGPVIRELDVHTNVLETPHSVIPEQVFSGYAIRFILLWLFQEKRKEKKISARLFKNA